MVVCAVEKRLNDNRRGTITGIDKIRTRLIEKRIGTPEEPGRVDGAMGEQ
jgi:hypothetical protein